MDSARYLAILFLLFVIKTSQAHLVSIGNGVKTEVFLSPRMELEPGLVSNKVYYNVDFSRGHIAIKDFQADVVDEKGNSIPLHETYLHHWVVYRYYQRKVSDATSLHSDDQPDYIMIKNKGMCGGGFSQYFGLGAETRGTTSHIPDPYAIVVGNPEEIPEGYEELWLLNVHAIDTRGAEDKLGCTECRCDLYNATVDEYGRVFTPDYVGGYRCCYGDMRCKVKKGFQGVKRNLYLRYTVKYVDMDTSIVPVQIYIIDITDTWTKADESKWPGKRHLCMVEYTVEACPVGVAHEDCIHKKSLSVSLPTGGDLIYAGGREICLSNPTYGTGNEAGNEAGYIVRMSSCYPSPGSVKIAAGEMLTFVSNYSSTQSHTGVMGLFYLLIADPSTNLSNVLHAPTEVHESTIMSNFGWAIALFGAALIAGVILVFKSMSGRGEGYEAITA